MQFEHRLFLPLFLLMITCIGCGPSFPPTAPVKGIVYLNDQPVAEAGVMFVPTGGGKVATGVTDANGAFELTTFYDGDGALLGEHIVTVSKNEVTGIEETEDELSGDVAPGGPKINWIVPEKYSSQQTSDMKMTVSTDQETYDIRITKP